MVSLRAKGDLLGHLIGTFLDEMPGQLTEIARALAQRDGQSAAINAHGLKGAAATFGAARMGEIAHRVCEAAERRAIDSALSQLENLRVECERVRRALNAERGRQIG
jgi:HPt (histidine-containing phosphotransfer) domain-containing protein